MTGPRARRLSYSILCSKQDAQAPPRIWSKQCKRACRFTVRVYTKKYSIPGWWDLYSPFTGGHSDDTHKGGVVCTEILLPSYTPLEFSDRQTLWNAAEDVVHGKKAQLAYSFDVALQSAFSLEENIALARQFLMERFVSRGMNSDVAVPMPDRGNGGISNPHFHVLCPIRPLGESGRWGGRNSCVCPGRMKRGTGSWTTEENLFLTISLPQTWGSRIHRRSGAIPMPTAATKSAPEGSRPVGKAHRAARAAIRGVWSDLHAGGAHPVPPRQPCPAHMGSTDTPGVGCGISPSPA